MGGSRLLLLPLTPGEGRTDINVPILEIRKLRQGLVQGYTAKKWPTNLSSHNRSWVELESFSSLGKNELFPLKSAFPFLSVSLIVVILLSSDFSSHFCVNDQFSQAPLRVAVTWHWKQRVHLRDSRIAVPQKLQLNQEPVRTHQTAPANRQGSKRNCFILSPCWSSNLGSHIPYHVTYFPDHGFV